MTASGSGSPSPLTNRSTYRLLDTITVLFCTVLVISNVAAIKALHLPFLPRIVMDGGNLLFPISCILGDVLVEVYGFANSRRVIWMGFGVNILATAFFSLIVYLPPAEGWELQNEFAAILSQTPRIVLGSIVAYWCGSFLNAYVMAKMKIWSNGKYLWGRAIGSTVVGQAADSILFTLIAFAGVWPRALLWKVILFNYVLKLGYEILVSPITCHLIARLKKAENADPYDIHTDFTPFRFGRD